LGSGLSHGKGIAGLLSLPLTDSFSIYGEYGRPYWHKDYSNGITSESKDGSDPFYGAGARFRINSALAFRLSYDRYSMDRTDIELDSVRVGVGANAPSHLVGEAPGLRRGKPVEPAQAVPVVEATPISGLARVSSARSASRTSVL